MNIDKIDSNIGYNILNYNVVFQYIMIKISLIKPNLYLGAGSHVKKNSREFSNLNVDVIISCCNEIVHKSNEKYVIENFPIDDGVDGTLYPWLDIIVDKMKLLNMYKRLILLKN